MNNLWETTHKNMKQLNFRNNEMYEQIRKQNKNMTHVEHVQTNTE